MAQRKLPPYRDEVYVPQSIIIHTVQGVPGSGSSFNVNFMRLTQGM